jgi:uncharacterized damage-inducible protein DinB
MPINQSLLPEFDHEVANTRKMLERVPEDKFSWKPHQKSMPLGRLAQHVAEIPGWAKETMTLESLDIAPPDGPTYQPAKLESRQQLLEMFERNIAAGRAAIAAATDEQLMRNWSLLAGGNPIFTMPRVSVLRSMIMNHMIHHRAQLGVYLRLHDIPVPGMYGPSADETAMPGATA